MDKNTAKDPKIESIFKLVISFILRFRILILIFIAILTVFFTYALFSLQIDANIFGINTGVPPSVHVLTPSDKPDGDPVYFMLPNDYKEFVPEQYGYIEHPENEKLHATIPDYMRQGRTYKSYGDGFVVIFSSSLLYTPEVLNLLYDVMLQLESLDKIGPCLSPFDFVTVEKRGSRLTITPMAPVQRGEKWTEETAAIFKERLLNDDMARNYLYSADGNTIMLYYRTEAYNQAEQDVLNAIIDPLRDYGRVAINGGSTIINRVTYYIFNDLGILLSLCFVVILLVYYLSYKSLRAVIIPSTLSIVGIIWTLGTMSLMGYKLTIISILTPCLVLTLGSSYSVHMLSEYFTEAKDPKIAVEGYARISKTILSACMTTIMGFISMLVCRMDMFRQFGISVTIGIAYCAILSILYLPSILSMMPQPKEKKVDKIKNGKIMGNFLHFVEISVTRHWSVILILFAILIVGYIYVNDKIPFNSNYVDYFPSDDPFVQDTEFFAKTMGGTDPYYLEIVAPNRAPGFFLEAENIKKVYDYENTVMKACPDIVQSLSFSQYVGFLNKVYSGVNEIPDSNGLINLLYRVLQQMKGYMGSDVLDVLINEDASVITLAMRNYDAFEQNLQTTVSAMRVEETLDHYRYMLPEGTTSRIYCAASTSLRANQMIVEDQNLATRISMIATIIIATFTLLSVFRGIAAIVPVVVGIMFSYVFMFITGIPFDLVTIGFSSITFGAGIDDALHFLLHYREIKKSNNNKSIEEVIKMTLEETGRPIILTTISIVAGMCMLLFASFTPIMYFGLFMSVSLTIAMLATLFVLPVVMIVSNKVKNYFTRRLRG